MKAKKEKPAYNKPDKFQIKGTYYMTPSPFEKNGFPPMFI